MNELESLWAFPAFAATAVGEARTRGNVRATAIPTRASRTNGVMEQPPYLHAGESKAPYSLSDVVPRAQGHHMTHVAAEAFAEGCHCSGGGLTYDRGNRQTQAGYFLTRGTEN